MILKTFKSHKNSYGPNNPFFGKHHSEESKRKMSLAHTGKILSKEHIEKAVATIESISNELQLKLK